MPLPGTWNTVTVTATFLRADTGGPAAGAVVFAPQRGIGIDDTVVLPNPITATLNGSGQITASLPCPDDAVAGFTTLVYKVIERIPFGRTYFVQLDNTMTAEVLGDLDPLTDDQAAYYSFRGPPGDVTPALLAAKESAEGAAVAAGASQSAAASSAGVASAAADAAAGSSVSAATHKDAAQFFANSASSSATASASSAAAASGSATAASGSAAASESSATAADASADAASLSASIAESASGPTYASIAAGEAGTATGQSFAVDNGDGTVSVYLRTAGGSTLERTLATTAALASSAGSALVGHQVAPGEVVRSARDKMRESISVKDFGATGDGVTDDSPAFVNAIAWLSAAGGVLAGSATLHVPAGDYYLGNTTLDLTHTLTIQGEGSGMVGGVATRLRWAGAAVGIRGQYYITEGDRQISAAPHGNGAGSILRGLHLNGGYSGAGAFHAVDMIARMKCEDVQAFNWAGNGFNINATAGGGAGLEGNANCFALNDCSAYGCANGVFLFGADANAGVVMGGDYSQNRGWGILDQSFLGNTYVGVHTAGNTLGPYKTENANARSLFLNCYSEGDQPPAQIAGPSLLIGGLQGADIAQSAPWLYAGQNFDLVCSAAGGFAVRPRLVGHGNTAHIALDATNSQIFFGGTAYNNCDLQLYGSDLLGGYNVQAGGKHAFSVDFANVLELDAAGANLSAGKVLKVGGTKVVGAQQAAIPNSGDATINAILAALRAHGLIAT